MRLNSNPSAQNLRQRLQILLNDCKIAMAICPISARASMATHVAELLATHEISSGGKIVTIDLDEGIKPGNASMAASSLGRYGCDSRLVAGTQLAHCAAHLIANMILEELGLVPKTVPASKAYEGQSGEIELPWTLWATVRYGLSGGTPVGGYDEFGFPEPIMKPSGLLVSDACSDAVKKGGSEALINCMGGLHSLTAHFWLQTAPERVTAEMTEAHLHSNFRKNPAAGQSDSLFRLLHHMPQTLATISSLD